MRLSLAMLSISTLAEALRGARIGGRLRVFGLPGNNLAAMSTNGDQKSPTGPSSVDPVVVSGSSGLEFSQVPSSEVNLTPSDFAEALGKVPKNFKPYPFPYHHEFTAVVESITNLGMGVCRLDVGGIAPVVEEEERGKGRRRRWKGKEKEEVDKTEGLEKGGGEFFLSSFSAPFLRSL